MGITVGDGGIIGGKTGTGMPLVCHNVMGSWQMVYDWNFSGSEDWAWPWWGLLLFYYIYKNNNNNNPHQGPWWESHSVDLPGAVWLGGMEQCPPPLGLSCLISTEPDRNADWCSWAPYLVYFFCESSSYKQTTTLILGPLQRYATFGMVLLTSHSTIHLLGDRKPSLLATNTRHVSLQDIPFVIPLVWHHVRR